jgi:hypothetical protein
MTTDSALQSFVTGLFTRLPCNAAAALLTARARLIIVGAMNGLNKICGICREIIR